VREPREASDAPDTERGAHGEHRNAHRQPTDAASAGTSWMVTAVSAKPSDVCSVSAVPTASGGTLSVTSTLNCALSAITKNPQASESGTTSQSDRAKASPMPIAHAPLRVMATVTSHARPRRSATRPPHTHPAPPTASAANATALAARALSGPADGSRAATLAARNAGSQVHAA
jgi:hypothetical protein